MAINIKVYPYLSPRIVEILSPTVEASVQEIVDAIRAYEDTVIGQHYDFIISASGKEDLDGGVFVGITAQLQNAQIAFQQRGIFDSSGTVTTVDPSGEILIDSAGSFITDGIQPGDSVINKTDNSMSTVIRVDSEIQLTHFALEGGTDNDWDSADAYLVWNKIKCEVVGGNLVAIDDVGGKIDAILPTALTFVLKSSASSATIVEVGGGQVWTETEKDDLITDLAITKDQSEIAALHALEELNN